MQQLPDVSVILTRRDDRYVTLEDRNRIANRVGADLFISIHANAAENRDARGIQTYYLNNATDQAAKRLADRENKVFKELGTVDRILSTMVQNANTEYSQDLAVQVQSSLVQSLSQQYSGVKDQHVRTALFYVLVGAKSPSVLVETSFISNPEEERRLKNPAYQQAIATSITQGVQAYMEGSRRARGNL